MSVTDAGTREVIHGRVEAGPVFVVGDRRIAWADFGEICVGSELTISYDPGADAGSGSADGDDDQRWIDGVALLAQCLPRTMRTSCPVDDLAVACQEARQSEADVWRLVGELAGWDDEPPSDDVDLWTSAAMALVSAPADGIDAFDVETVASLDAMDLNDWLAAVIELIRCGAGTIADAESLVALAARCLDVDSAAVDTRAGTSMRRAFGAIVPVWRALGAVDDTGVLTRLGAWGIPHALARAWGGELTPAGQASRRTDDPAGVPSQGRSRS